MARHITPEKHGLGWVPDLPDQRDLIFRGAQLLATVRIPEVVDLRDQCPAVYDQGQLGSCTAQALAAAFDFDRHKQGKPFMEPSRLFIYWNERKMEGSVDTDAGAYIRDGVKTLVKEGVCHEQLWPYDISEFRKQPEDICYTEGLKNQALKYERIVTPHSDKTRDMIACLATGVPFVSGISVYESFESKEASRTGIIPMPSKNERFLGGHAILAVGYNLTKKWFICRNSWGTDWGDDGYFYLPFAYLANRGLAADMWVIRTVEEGDEAAAHA